MAKSSRKQLQEEYEKARAYAEKCQLWIEASRRMIRTGKSNGRSLTPKEIKTLQTGLEALERNQPRKVAAATALKKRLDALK